MTARGFTKDNYRRNMASGRMITNQIASDKRINGLSSDTCRLAFTWLITFADCEGRTHGDPAMVRSLIFPRRQDITIETTEAFIREWALCGLIVWYEAEDDLWIYFVNFDKNQPGMRKEKESPSRIPLPPEMDYSVLSTEEGRQLYGVTAAQLPIKRKEVKRKEEKEKPPRIEIEGQRAERLYREITGRMSFTASEKIQLLDAFHVIFQKFKSDLEVIGYLQPYFLTFKERYPNSIKGFWVTDWAVSGQIPPAPSKNDRPPERRIKYDGDGKPVEVE